MNTSHLLPPLFPPLLVKKILFFCGLLAGATAAAHAQTGVRLGLKVGVARTDLTGNYTQDLKGKFGVLAGLVANVGVADGFSVQAELLYAQKGAAAKNDSSGIRLNYVDLPVLLHYAAHSFFVEAGPQVGLLVAAKQTQRGRATLDEKPSFRVVELGYALGLGYQPSESFSVGLRYTGDFRAIDQTGTYSYRYIAAPTNPRNRAVQLYATYLFGKK